MLAVQAAIPKSVYLKIPNLKLKITLAVSGCEVYTFSEML